MHRIRFVILRRINKSTYFEYTSCLRRSVISISISHQTDHPAGHYVAVLTSVPSIRPQVTAD
jgi:hypothetical protein